MGCYIRSISLSQILLYGESIGDILIVSPVKIELGSRLGSHWDPALYPTGIFGRDPSPHLLGSQSISHHIPLGSQYTSNRDPSTHPTGIPVHIPPYPTGIPVHIQPGSQSISHRNPTISHRDPSKKWDFW